MYRGVHTPRSPEKGPGMIPHEVIRQIRRLHLKARRAVENLLGGEYHSVFKGTGIAFEEVREYQPGDDIRSIDWNVTARMGHPFVKRFIEERELTVMLLVDTSASQQFGTLFQQKREVALPSVGMVQLEDSETGQRLLLDTRSRAVRERYAEMARQRREAFLQLARSAGTDIIEVATDGGHLDALVRFFRLRERRSRR